MHRVLHEKTKIIRCALCLLTCLFLWGCASQMDSPTGLRITVGLTIEPGGIDPHRFESPQTGIIARQLYDTLVYRDPQTREIVPGLAESWTISDDRLAYTFYLKQNVTFHDGTSFDATSVAANLDRIIDPLTASQKARSLLGPYVSYEIIDPLTIRLLLSEPYAPLLDALSQPYLGMGSPAAFEEYGIDRYQFHQAGTGPFQLVEYTPGGDVILRRNEAYNWGPSFYTPPGEQSIDEIVFRFYPDTSTRLAALQSGEAQIVMQLSPSGARALASNSSIRLYPVAMPGLPLQLLMDVSQYPTDNAAVRQALIFATNRQAIVDAVYQSFPQAAWGPLTASSLDYDPQVVGQLNHNVQQARALLTTAGFVDADGNGFLDAGDSDLEVTVLTPSSGLTPDVLRIIQEQWAEIGILMRIEQVPGEAALRERAAQGNYNLVLFSDSGYDPVILNESFILGAANAFTQYNNVQLDETLRAAAREANPNARRELYNRIQQFILSEALVVPILDPVNLNASTANIDGLSFDPYGWYPLLNNVVMLQGT